MGVQGYVIAAYSIIDISACLCYKRQIMGNCERPELRVPRGREDSDYDSDSEGVLVYWYQGYRPLLPAAPILDPDIFIGKIGQQNVLPTHFTIKPKDLVITEIFTPNGRHIGDVLPGISCYVFFGTRWSNQHNLELMVRDLLCRALHPKNRMYVTQVRDIIKAGWTPYYAPLINQRCPIINPLHVILCPDSVTRTGTYADANEKEKEQLAKAFVRWSCD